MEEQDVRAKLIQIIAEEGKLEEKEFVHGQLLADLLDSLTILEIACQVEDEFKVQIDDKQIPNLKTFDDIVNGVLRLMAE
jgi:acyl carrier protein